MENIARNLVEYFWKIIEDISLGQTDLRLEEHQGQAWKQRLLVRKDGKPWQNIESPFLTVCGLSALCRHGTASGVNQAVRVP